MRIIFLGTPEFAVPTLERLITWPKGEVVAVVCQPDRPSGRGRNVFPPPVKLVAQAHGITVLQPEKLSKSPETVEAMRAKRPDVLVMVAFGQILKEPVLAMAQYGTVNIHGSLLPAYRGPAPINWAIINGEAETGITTMFSDKGVDTGKMLLKQAVPIDSDMDSEQLSATLSLVGADLLVATLEGLLTGSIQAETQDESKATYAPLLKKELGLIDWSKPAQSIHNLVRGLYGWPGTHSHFQGGSLKISRTKVAKLDLSPAAQPGEVVSVGERLLVACGESTDTVLELLEVQPPNKARMPARDWANGVRLSVGTTFGA